METHKKIDLSLDEARELYKGGNKTVKEFVLSVFSEDELSENHRSHSAKLRIVERIYEDEK